MSTVTIDVPCIADTELVSAYPDMDYGIRNDFYPGVFEPNWKKVRPIFKFKIPDYNGIPYSQKLRFNITANNLATDEIFAVHLLDASREYVWNEGFNNGGVPAKLGATWNAYAKDLPWSAAGGDFSASPIATVEITTGVPTGRFVIDIDPDSLLFRPGQEYTLVLKAADEALTGSRVNYIGIDSREVGGDYAPMIRMVVDDTGFVISPPTAESVSSTQIDLSWEESPFDEDFASYEIEQSPTGTGSWTAVTTITDRKTITFQHTGLVVQGDVDDTDEDSDTYPNGRTIYYRMRVNSNVLGNGTWSTNSVATTIPAVRPIKAIFAPKSPAYEDDFVDDNVALYPHGTEVTLEWYDTNDKTENQYVSHVVVERSRYNGYGFVPTDFSFECDSLEKFVEIVYANKTEWWYHPVRMDSVKIYDTGGLFRYATLDKTTIEVEVVWPSPVPSAIPEDLSTPYSAGDEIPVDLSAAGQILGSDIFLEDFQGVLSDPDKWTIDAGIPAYVSGNRIDLPFQTFPSQITKKMRDGSGNNYFLTEKTGAYRIRCVFYIPSSWTFGTLNHHHELYFYFAGDFTNGNVYYVRWSLHADYTYLYRVKNNITTTLASYFSPILNPRNHTGEYFGLEFYIAPLFKPGALGSTVCLTTMSGASVAAALNFDYSLSGMGTSRAIIVNDNPGTLPNQFSGTTRIRLKKVGTPANKNPLQAHHFQILGRADGVFGAKNITLDEATGLGELQVVPLTALCEPDQASQVIDVEGRIKNSYGAQSRTANERESTTVNNATPIPILIAPTIGYKDVSVSIDGSQSADPEGGSLLYTFDFGDGSAIIITASPIISHVYTISNHPGLSSPYDTGYTIKLKVKDEAGNESGWVERIIEIWDALTLFEEVNLMSPWEGINEEGTGGTGITELPEVDYDIVQTGKGGNRRFSLRGIHCDPDGDHTLDVRIANAEAEKRFIHSLYNQGTLITLDLENFGKVKGAIDDHKPSMGYDDQQAFHFTMMFQEIDPRQFGE